VIVRLLVLVLAAMIAVVVVKLVVVVALVSVAICATWYAYRFLRALVPALSHARPHGVRPLAQPRISERR
jgi:hypothetical protein